MKKQLVVVVLLVLTLLGGCSEKVYPEKSGAKIGESKDVKGVAYTLKEVSKTKERSAGNPAKYVIQVDYFVENKSEQLVSVGMDVELFDQTDFPLSFYPLDTKIVPINPGESTEMTVYFETDTLGTFEIQFTPFPTNESQTVSFITTIH